MTADPGGRVFFSSAGRSLEGEDEVRLTSVGIDIGSSTTHLLFSRLVLERLDNRYVVAERAVLHQSEVLLTPYAGDELIDAASLGRFIDLQYRLAGIAPDAIDTGALILTGVAARRTNARAIGAVLAAQAGRFVALSAGDALEATLAAFGSGAAARSIATSLRVMNVDIGGGTSKIAVCENGEVAALTALDVGARLFTLDAAGRVLRIEQPAQRIARQAGVELHAGVRPTAETLQRLVDCLADRLFEAMSSAAPGPQLHELARLPLLRNAVRPDIVTFSGGVSEYLYGREEGDYGDVGRAMARAIRARAESWGPRLEAPSAGLRATVVGASQYSVQLSGSTIYVVPQSILPLRNVPVVAPRLPLHPVDLSPGDIAASIGAALQALDLADGQAPAALCYRWEGSATFHRLDAFCRGVARAFQRHIERGVPLILVGGSDVGGLIGIHCREELGIAAPVVSIDGIGLANLDFIDIGALLDTSGSVPVVVKSLVFPAADAPPAGAADARPLRAAESRARSAADTPPPPAADTPVLRAAGAPPIQ